MRSRSQHRRGASSSEERRERTKGREEEVRPTERERRQERESVTPEKKRAGLLPVVEKRKEAESESSLLEAKESEGISSKIEQMEVDEGQDEPEVEDKGEAKIEKDPSFRFEHLEAIRNVQLITRNEYPLDHLQRDKLVNRGYDDYDDEDGDGICYCSYPDDLDKDKKRCDDVSCLNFATYVECTAHCPAREYCSNQRLQHPHLFPKLEAFKVSDSLSGLFVRYLHCLLTFLSLGY